MNKTLKYLAASTALVFAFAMFSTSQISAQAAQDFTVINKTGVEIYALYVSSKNTNNWGEDILGVDTLPNYEAVKIRFSRNERAKLWDLRVEDEDGTYIEWKNINLFEISTVTLYFEDGEPTAVFDEVDPE